MMFVVLRLLIASQPVKLLPKNRSAVRPSADLRKVLLTGSISGVQKTPVVAGRDGVEIPAAGFRLIPDAAAPYR